jgi:hypothetical protein
MAIILQDPITRLLNLRSPPVGYQAAPAEPPTPRLLANSRDRLEWRDRLRSARALSGVV